MKTLLIYTLIGLVVAVVCDQRQLGRPLSSRVSSFALALAAWPLWGPVVWMQAPNHTPLETSLVARCRTALAEARSAVQGTALDGLLPERLTTQLLNGLLQVQARHAELSQLLTRPEFRTRAADDGLLAQDGARPARRARDENVRRLRELQQRDERLLDEITELAEALRTQLLVARYTGSHDPGAGVGELLTALSARVESMDAWFELDNVRGPVNTEA